MKPRRLARERVAGHLWLGQDVGEHGATVFMPLVLGGKAPDWAVEVYARREWTMGRVSINGTPCFHTVGYLNRREYRRFRWWVVWFSFLTADWSERWLLLTTPWRRWKRHRQLQRYEQEMRGLIERARDKVEREVGW